MRHVLDHNGEACCKTSLALSDLDHALSEHEARKLSRVAEKDACATDDVCYVCLTKIGALP